MQAGLQWNNFNYQNWKNSRWCRSLDYDGNNWLEGAENLPLETNDSLTQTCPVCQEIIDPDDEIAKFFCQRNGGESIETCSDGVVYGLHGFCLDQGMKLGMKMFKCFKFRQHEFYQ